MNILELHIIQNFPASRMGRDENNSPKSMIFGGAVRARISSQTYKRAVREYLKETDKTHFGGVRTKALSSTLKDELVLRGMDVDLSNSLSKAVAEHLGKMDGEKTKNVLFLSKNEMTAIAEQIITANSSGKLDEIFKIAKDDEKNITGYTCQSGKFLKDVTPTDVADIEIFGRMMASDPDLDVEGSIYSAHIFSVHECENEIDFFITMDETADKNDRGAGFMDETPFNSACYYNCVCIDLDLFMGGRLSVLPIEVRRNILQNFIEACIMAVPDSGQHSMLCATAPSSVLGVVRKGSVKTLANAFEEPIFSRDGYSKKARRCLETFWEEKKREYGKRQGILVEAWFPDDNLDDFLGKLVTNV